jgi:4-hydroxybenzoyl-CoA thioesterase
MSAFEKIVPVRFEDCDPAGIVFYPRYFLMINRFIEDWFGEALGYPWDRMHGNDKAGVPTVRIEIDFKAPSRHGDQLRLSLDVLEVGRSAFTLAIRATGAQGGDIRFAARQILAFAQAEDGVVRSRALPEPIAAAMRAAMGEETAS